MKYKVIQKDESIVNYFEKQDRAEDYTNLHFVNGKVIDCETKKVVYDACRCKEKVK